MQSGGGITASTKSGNGGNIDLEVKDLLVLRDRGLISAEAMNQGNGGNINLNSGAIALINGSSIVADAMQGKGGNIDITTVGLFVSPNSLITASSEFGLDGNVRLESINGDRPLELDQLPENLVDRTQQIAKTCGGGKNQFAIAGRGGLPENPLQNLRGQTVWQDLRLTAIDSSNSEIEADSPAKLILEAQAWKINDQGQIELIAINDDAPRLDNQGGCN